MVNIYCKNCGNYVEPNSGKCPKCEYQFTLKDIIPDNEVEEFKSNKMSSNYIHQFIIIGICIMMFVIGSSTPFIGFIWTMLGYCFLPLVLVQIWAIIKESNKDFEEWRIDVSKTWKYQSNSQRAITILKIIGKVS